METLLTSARLVLTCNMVGMIFYGNYTFHTYPWDVLADDVKSSGFKTAGYARTFGTTDKIPASVSTSKFDNCKPQYCSSWATYVAARKIMIADVHALSFVEYMTTRCTLCGITREAKLDDDTMCPKCQPNVEHTSPQKTFEQFSLSQAETYEVEQKKEQTENTAYNEEQAENTAYNDEHWQQTCKQCGWSISTRQATVDSCLTCDLNQAYLAAQVPGYPDLQQSSPRIELYTTSDSEDFQPSSIEDLDDHLGNPIPDEALDDSIPDETYATQVKRWQIEDAAYTAEHWREMCKQCGWSPRARKGTFISCSMCDTDQPMHQILPQVPHHTVSNSLTTFQSYSDIISDRLQVFPHNVDNWWGTAEAFDATLPVSLQIFDHSRGQSAWMNPPTTQSSTAGFFTNEPDNFNFSFITSRRMPGEAWQEIASCLYEEEKAKWWRTCSSSFQKCSTIMDDIRYMALVLMSYNREHAPLILDDSDDEFNYTYGDQDWNSEDEEIMIREGILNPRSTDPP
jgi:hypothetical protein